MRDNKLVFFDNADIATSPTSNVIEVAAASIPARTGTEHGYAKNVSGAIYLNVIVNADITGAEVVTLEDSADGSSWAATSTVITVGAALAGEVFSMPIPADVRDYMRVVETVGTAGTITVFLGQNEEIAQ